MYTKAINATVFLTGAAILVIEVSATRTLAPYFGNTIFSISSILSVVLGALAVGYLLGGKIADRHPTPYIFFSIIWVAGIAVLILNFVARFFLHSWAHIFGAMLGPLIASFVLFFTPNFFLGMLSPFAVRLKSDFVSKNGVGGNSGEVFFFSTAGSILGSLVTGFVLIPHAGISLIVLATGIGLLVLGLVGIIGFKKRDHVFVVLLVVSAFISAISFMFVLHEPPFVVGELYHQDGIYERITVADNPPGVDGKRVLFLDRNLSTSVALSDGSPLATPYAQYLELAKLLLYEPKHILVLGGGAYAVPRYAAQLFPQAQIDVVEIEPRLPALAQKLFYLSDTSHITTYTQDGRAFLQGTSVGYDLIFIDVYSSFLSIPEHMTTKEFFELVQSHLANNGMVMMNVAGSLKEGQNAFLQAQTKTFSTIFPEPFIFALAGLQEQVPQNFVFVGIKENLDVASLLQQSQDPFLASIRSRQININSLTLDKAMILTDDFAPVDYLNAPLVARY